MTIMMQPPRPEAKDNGGIPQVCINTLGRRARAQVNDDRREQVRGRILLVYGNQNEYDGVFADARLFREP
jgi:hypothetical protein